MHFDARNSFISASKHRKSSVASMDRLNAIAWQGKPQPVASRNAEKLGPEERGLIDTYLSLDKKDRKFLVTTARMMAKRKRTARPTA